MRLDQLGDRVDQAGPAESLGLDAADDLEGDVVIGDLHDLDGAVRRTHAAPDRAALEGRPGGRCGGDDGVPVAEHDLAVGADVDEQPRALVAVHAGREHPRHDVATDVGTERREDCGAGTWVQVQPQVLGQDAGWVGGGHHEGRDAQRLGIDAQRERRHRGVARERHLVDMRRIDLALDADLLRQLVEGLAGQCLQAPECIGVHHRGADPGDHVAAEGLLLVQSRGDGHRGAEREVEQRGHDRGGAEVEGDRVAHFAGVARLDIDQGLVDHDGGHLEVGLAQHLREPPQHRQVDGQLQVVDRLGQPGEVGALVGQ